MHLNLSTLSLSLVSLIVACGGGGGGGGGGADGGGGGGAADAPPACVTPTAITGTPSMATVDDEIDPGSGSNPGAQSIDYEAMLDAMTGIEITLYTKTTDYPGGTVGPESVMLTGDDAQFATCGTCVVVYGGIGSGGETAGETYLGTGGTVAITSTTTNFTGTLTDIVLTKVDIDPTNNTSTVASPACTSGIANLAFSAPITVDSGSAAAAPHSLHIKLPTGARKLH